MDMTLTRTSDSINKVRLELESGGDRAQISYAHGCKQGRSLADKKKEDKREYL